MGGDPKGGLLRSENVIAHERKLLGIENGRPSAGLALSGGGIRSASFGLGVLQALLENHVLDKIDYLSTVSGGGYIGSALTWFRKRHAGIGEAFFDDTHPFGRKHRGVRNPAEGKGKIKSDFLSFLRQRGNYLAPDRQLNAMALAATVMRSMIVSLLVYMTMLVVAVSLMIFVSHLACRNGRLLKMTEVLVHQKATAPPPSSYITIDWSGDGGKCTVVSHTPTAPHTAWPDSCMFRFSLFLSVLSAGLLLLAAVAYSIATAIWGALKVPQGRSQATPDGSKLGRYANRTWVQIVVGRFLHAAIVFGILATVPIAYAVVHDNIVSLGLAGSVSGVWAALGRVRKHLGQDAVFKKQWVGTLLFRAGAALFVYSMLLLAYHLSLEWIRIPATADAGLPDMAALSKTGGLFIFSIGMGFIANINYSTIGRMYRDRLMEAFLPDDKAIMSAYEKTGNDSFLAIPDADGALLEDMCWNDDTKTIIRPYHIINSNIILINSPKGMFRGRGGDSFILAPQFCGSDATGYIETRRFIKHRAQSDQGGMTLATAMATSGAAVNPNTGVGGKGVTRDFFVSLMMTIFNLRLGYWATNPRRNSPLRSPNYWRPGICGLLGFGYREDSLFVELSDGGHFENLGLYELIRRRVDTIIVSDAGADKDFNFGDLANAIERVRVDFGVGIRLKSEDEQFGKLLPGSSPDTVFAAKFKLAEEGFASGTVSYPAAGCEAEKMGKIFLIKTTLLPNLPGDLYGYKARHADFPDQTTSDQFFDENQFEAYRELGYRAADRLCRETNLATMI
jgi:hypothetical protein